MNLRVFLAQTLLLCPGLMFPACRLFSQTDAPADDLTRETLKFAQIYGILEENYVDPLDPDRAIFDGGTRGMLSALDPFSAFFDPEQFELLQQQARGKALGFGSILYVQPGKVLVLQTAEGSPAWRAGLGPGDEIVEVNSTRLDRLDLQSLIQLLEKSRSQPARLGVIRPGRYVSEEFRLSPTEVALPTVDKAFLFAPGTGYIHLSGFEQRTTKEVVEALTRLGNSRLSRLVFDLRDNHGGMLESTLEVASLFLKSDALVLTVRGRAAPEKSYRTSSSSFHFDIPLVVLVNENTASAAEVFTAALQEHDRALIVGEPTFGKGVVETVMSLSEKTGLALTTAQYFTSSGRSIQRPFPGTALPVTAANGSGAPSGPAFHTDKGRPIYSGGGIKPDVLIPARTLDPWVAYLNQRGAFTNFASNYLTRHGRVTQSFEPDPETLESFKDFLAREQIRVPDEYWSQDQTYLKLRIKTEIYNLVFGLAAGDEVEARGDPQVRRAAMFFPLIPQLLETPGSRQGTTHVRRVAK